MTCGRALATGQDPRTGCITYHLCTLEAEHASPHECFCRPAHVFTEDEAKAAGLKFHWELKLERRLP